MGKFRVHIFSELKGQKYVTIKTCLSYQLQKFSDTHVPPYIEEVDSKTFTLSKPSELSRET